MPQRFVGCDREQVFLMPPSVDEWLPGDHFAWFVVDAVAELDLAEFYAVYRVDGRGRPAYDPAVLVGVLLYAYAVGVRSSRAIERRCVEDVAFRVVVGNVVPDHVTIARFRAGHQERLRGLFSQVLGLCARAGLVSSGVVAVDSTKFAANASRDANRDWEQIAMEILQEAAEIDEREDRELGERRGGELPPELSDARGRREWLRRELEGLAEREGEQPVARGRRQRLKRSQRQLKARQQRQDTVTRSRQVRQQQRRARGQRPVGRPRKTPLEFPDTPRGRVNVTDPDSRIVKTREGFIQGYSAQAVANEHQIVIACELTANGAGDGAMLERMIRAACEQLANAGIEIDLEAVLADTGYWSQREIAAVSELARVVLVPPEAARTGKNPHREGGMYEQMRDALERNPELYKLRQQIIEPIFGHTKANRRFDRFLRRGLAACRSEWSLITTTHNLQKLYRATVLA